MRRVGALESARQSRATDRALREARGIPRAVPTLLRVEVHAEAAVDNLQLHVPQAELQHLDITSGDDERGVCVTEERGRSPRYLGSAHDEVGEGDRDLA